MAGLEPRGFRWVIAGRMAVSERIGGYGFQHRRVRREEEIIWLKEQGINTVLTLLPGNQNQAAYEAAGFAVWNVPIDGELEEEIVPQVREHLADCAECTELLATMEQIAEAGSCLADLEPPAHLVEAVLGGSVLEVPFGEFESRAPRRDADRDVDSGLPRRLTPVASGVGRGPEPLELPSDPDGAAQ